MRRGRPSERGFRLPEGDIQAGEAAFAELKCTLCHSVEGVDFAGIAPGTGHVLGGEVRRVQTYGELVTAVIDPNHSVASKYAATHPTPEGKPAEKSPMPSRNSTMTVRQLSDIVTFLHSRYREKGPEFPDYPGPYPMP